MANETIFPPLKVWFDGTNYWLTDGFHRLAAAATCGFKYVKAWVHCGSLQDALWDSFCANSQHGLRRKRSDIVTLIQRALEHSKASSLSNVELAKHLGIPETTIRRWRGRLSSPHDDDRCREVRRKGTTYTFHLNQFGKNTEQRSVRPKSNRQLNQELVEMKASSSPELTPILNAIEGWMGGGTTGDCLRAIEEFLSSRRQGL